MDGMGEWCAIEIEFKLNFSCSENSIDRFPTSKSELWHQTNWRPFSDVTIMQSMPPNEHFWLTNEKLLFTSPFLSLHFCFILYVWPLSFWKDRYKQQIDLIEAISIRQKFHIYSRFIHRLIVKFTTFSFHLSCQTQDCDEAKWLEFKKKSLFRFSSLASAPSFSKLKNMTFAIDKEQLLSAQSHCVKFHRNKSYLANW